MAGYTSVDNDVLTELLKLPGDKTTQVYLVLLSHRNQRSKLCNPSQETIAAECHIDVSTVRRSIKRLVDAHLLTVSPQMGRYGKASNHYYFPTGRGQQRPLGRGQQRPGYRAAAPSPRDQAAAPSKQERSEQDEDIAYCNTRGHNWGEVDNGDTLYCGRCGQEQPNNVIAL